MNGSFFITTPLPPAPPRPKVPTLHGSIRANGTATLQPRSVPAGTVRIVVRDVSRRHGFRLKGRGVNRSTQRAFMGSVTWRVRLAKGVYRFGNERGLPGRLSVS